MMMTSAASTGACSLRKKPVRKIIEAMSANAVPITSEPPNLYTNAHAPCTTMLRKPGGGATRTTQRGRSLRCRNTRNEWTCARYSMEHSHL